MSENLRGRLAGIIVVVMLAVFAYGLIRFFDAPLYECILGNCGKPLQPHDAAYAHQFLGWQTTLFVVWAVGLFALWLLRNRREKK
jgi:hypothetical protein